MKSENLTRPSEVRRILERLDFKPSKVLGQNFLIDRNILDQLMQIANLSPHDVVLEVGPGLGVVTHVLAEKAARVIAVEKDERLYRYLNKHVCHVPHVELHYGDILDLFPTGLPLEDVTKVVANLPYSVSGRFLADLCLHAPGPQDIVITVQQEVGQRLAAKPGSSAYGVLSVFAQSRYEAQLCKTISASCFLPRPRVQSAIVHLQKREAYLLTPAQTPAFRHLVKSCFSRRRKQLGTILDKSSDLPAAESAQVRDILRKSGLSLTDRPGEVPPDTWVELAACTASAASE